jgi:hypothetical protein
MNLVPLTSLPRSGSTLLLYILNQNLKFTIGPDSEVGQLLNYTKQFLIDNIYHFQLPHEKVTDCFINFCRSGVDSWIKTISTEQNTFVDKSRHWLKDLDFIFTVFPEIKIIVTIRDLRSIVNSFEKISQESLYIDREDHFNFKTLNEDLHIQRITNILNLHYVKDGLFSLKQLVDIPKKHKDQIFISRYEDLIENPQEHLNQIYDFLNIDRHTHDFENITQDFYNDNPYQPFGKHKIKSKIEKNKEESFPFLRTDVQDMIFSDYYWYFKEFYPEKL